MQTWERSAPSVKQQLAAATVDGGFREMAAVASGTRTNNYFYHANINPMAHEHLTPAPWGEAIDLLEKNLGLEGQASGLTGPAIPPPGLPCDT